MHSRTAALILSYSGFDLSGSVAAVFDALFQGDDAKTDNKALVTAIERIVGIFAQHGDTRGADRIRVAARESFARAIAFGERYAKMAEEGDDGAGGGVARENEETARATAAFERLEPNDWRDRDFVTDPETSLADDMDRVIRWTKNIRSYLALDVDAPTGILLVGPPGTGKTVAAHRIAAMNGKRLIIGRHDAIQSSLLGQNLKNIRALLEAGVQEDAYLFLDEVDGIARDRKLAGPTDGHRIELLESLLEQLSILKKRNPEQIIFAATNLPEALDPAFVRRMAITIPFGYLSKVARRSLVDGLYTRVDCDTDALDLLLERSDDKSADYLRSLAMAAAREAVDVLSVEEMAQLAQAFSDKAEVPPVRPRVTREHVATALKIVREKHEKKEPSRTRGGAILLGQTQS